MPLQSTLRRLLGYPKRLNMLLYLHFQGILLAHALHPFNDEPCFDSPSIHLQFTFGSPTIHIDSP